MENAIHKVLVFVVQANITDFYRAYKVVLLVLSLWIHVIQDEQNTTTKTTQIALQTSFKTLSSYEGMGYFDLLMKFKTQLKASY